MKIQKTLSNFLFKTLLALIPLTLFVLAYSYSINALANYIYENTTGQISFLAPLTVHKESPQTTKPLHIEYSVLRVPAGKTTVVKK